jgi:integrase
MEDISPAGPYRDFDDSEITSLLADCHKFTPQTLLAKAKDVRDACAILLASTHQLRPSQIVALDVQNFECTLGEHGALILTNPRNDLPLVIDLTARTRAILDQWLTLRNLLSPRSEALFVGLHHGWRPAARPLGERLTVRGLRAAFDYRQRTLNIKHRQRSLDSLRPRRIKRLKGRS